MYLSPGRFPVRRLGSLTLQPESPTAAGQAVLRPVAPRPAQAEGAGAPGGPTLRPARLSARSLRGPRGSSCGWVSCEGARSRNLTLPGPPQGRHKSDPQHTKRRAHVRDRGAPTQVTAQRTTAAEEAQPHGSARAGSARTGVRVGESVRMRATPYARARALTHLDQNPRSCRQVGGAPGRGPGPRRERTIVRSPGGCCAGCRPAAGLR